MMPGRCTERLGVLGEITEQKTYESRNGLMRITDLALISGARKRLIYFACFWLMCDRSVHNTRIERLWLDFTQGIGGKWKDFFLDLESHHGLLPDFPAHIWLLHWLFLDAINDEIQGWADAWNHHRISLRGDTNCSPRELFLFSISEDGVRGVEHMDNDETVDPDTYGIDWEVDYNPILRRHFLENNLGQDEDFTDSTTVICEVAGCPLTEDAVYELEARLETHVNSSSKNMTARRFIWQVALEICYDLQVNYGLGRYVNITIHLFIMLKIYLVFFKNIL
jgi:hypothetical protein